MPSAAVPRAASATADFHPAPNPHFKAGYSLKNRGHKSWRQLITKSPTMIDADNRSDELVPDPQVWRELGVTSMTGWR